MPLMSPRRNNATSRQTFVSWTEIPIERYHWLMTKYIITGIAFSFLTSIAFANGRLEECAKPESWAASMAQTHLKNAGLLINEEIDFSKTQVNLLASEKKEKGLFHQVQKIIFTKKDGKKITVITENDASNDECSMTGVKVFVISKELGR